METNTDNTVAAVAGLVEPTSDNYTGWIHWTPTNEEWSLFEVTKKPPFEMTENQYLMVYVDEDHKHKMVTQYCYSGGKLNKIGRSSIKFRGPEKDMTITARNDEQVCAIDMLKDGEKTVKLLTGTWGTGKDLLMTTAALELLRANKFEQIVWIRNNVDVRDTKDLGALPGDVNEKLLPFLGPFIDHAGKLEVERMIEREQLVIEPLQSLRGRNLANSIIICSESENLTLQQIQLIIARAAEGSEVWLNADCRQRDKAIFERSQGIEKTIAKLKGNPLFGYVHLVKSERSPTAALADLLNED